MLTNFRFFAALCLFLGLQALAFRITSPARDAQWKTGNRETVSWEVSCFLSWPLGPVKRAVDQAMKTVMT